jgi:hypothetical protein
MSTLHDWYTQHLYAKRRLVVVIKVSSRRNSDIFKSSVKWTSVAFGSESSVEVNGGKTFNDRLLSSQPHDYTTPLKRFKSDRTYFIREFYNSHNFKCQKDEGCVETSRQVEGLEGKFLEGLQIINNLIKYMEWFVCHVLCILLTVYSSL